MLYFSNTLRRYMALCTTCVATASIFLASEGHSVRPGTLEDNLDLPSSRQVQASERRRSPIKKAAAYQRHPVEMALSQLPKEASATSNTNLIPAAKTRASEEGSHRISNFLVNSFNASVAEEIGRTPTKGTHLLKLFATPPRRRFSCQQPQKSLQESPECAPARASINGLIAPRKKVKRLQKPKGVTYTSRKKRR